jgi:cob(I)alamin adenosyltransferase
MIKLPKIKIYTRAGDKGQTTIASGERVSKDHPRIAAYGDLDELSSCLGVVVSFTRDKKLIKVLQQLQNELFNIGAELANMEEPKKIRLEQGEIDKLERLIDQYSCRLKPPHTFIIPGGMQGASFLHLARTICRRAEREVVSLNKKERINPSITPYLNRLSDLLFVLARYLNKKGKSKEIPWKKG